MPKQSKTEYFHLRMTPSMKVRLFERAAELGKEPSKYLTELMEKDIAGYDLTDTEKPRMKEFSRQVGLEMFNKVAEHFDTAYMKTKGREEKILALTLLNYRQTFFQFQRVISRSDVTNKLSDDQIKGCEEKSRKDLNEVFEKFLEFVLTNDSEKIVSYLQKPV